MSLNSSMQEISTKFAELNKERLEIEGRVVMLRPYSLNKDLLEERVRLVLGYRHPDEMAIITPAPLL